MKNIDIDIDIDMVILENIDIDIDIDEEILKNIDIDIGKAILQNIDIDKILYRFEFGIYRTALVWFGLVCLTRRLYYRAVTFTRQSMVI